MTTNPDEIQNMLAEAVALFGQMLEPLTEAVDGYRVRLDALGYGDETARRMAADYHAALLRQMIR